MAIVAILSVNPAIDVSTSVDRTVPIRKLRCTPAERDPGGGGINVARVIRRLGGDAAVIYPAGGSTGQLLQRLVGREGIENIVLESSEETREDFAVIESSTANQFRFVLPGVHIAAIERMKISSWPNGTEPGTSAIMAAPNAKGPSGSYRSRARAFGLIV